MGSAGYALALALAAGPVPDVEPDLSEPVKPRAEPRDAGSAAVASRPRVTIALSSAIPETYAASIELALRAQLGDLEIDLDLRQIDLPPELEAQARTAEALDPATESLAVLWVITTDRSIALYLLDRSRPRVLAREVERTSAEGQAEVEAIAVIARRSVAAVLAQRPVGMDAVPLHPTPASKAPVRAPPPAPAPNGARGRFAAGYVGTLFAPEKAWLSGVGISAGFVSRIGITVRVGYHWYPRIRVDDPAIRFSLRRNPIVLAAGYRLRRRWWALDAELAAVLDVLAPDVESVGAGAQVADAGSRLAFGLVPQARFGVLPVEFLELFAGVGPAFYVNAFSYAGRVPDERPLLRPHTVRVFATAGIAFLVR